jgi:hypothetical protein
VTFGTAAYGDNIKFQWFKNGTAIPGATNSFYQTAALTTGDNGAKYHVVVNNAVNSITSSDATLTVKAATLVQGYLRRDFYVNGTRTGIEQGISGVPNRIEALPSFETPVNDGVNNFAERISGYFIPPTTGNYVFFISADDDSDLFLSTDADPAHKQMIAQETGWSNSREWTVSSGGSNLGQKRSDQFSPDEGVTVPFSAGIPLTAGTKYYIEGVHHQGGGGDNFSVTYIKVGDADPVSSDSTAGTTGEATKLVGPAIAFNTTPITSLSISQEPQDTTLTEGFTGTFSVTAQTDSELVPKYQWKKNGADIAGATNSVYAITAAAADNNAKFSVAITLPGSTLTATSSDATLTVRSPVFTSGFLKYEVWNGKVKADVEGGTAGAPTTVDALSKLQTTFHSGAPDNYADRASGFFIPATTGNYVFFFGSDDAGDLYLSTDDTAANKKLIAQETVYSNESQWTASAGNSDLSAKRSDQFVNGQWPTPNVITLTAGHRYYIEVDHQEGGGGDWLGVYAKLETEDDPVDGTASNVSGSQIGFFVAPSSVTITTPPANTVGTIGYGATLNVAATTDSQVDVLSYQWQRNGVNIPGAIGSNYLTSVLYATNNNDKYTVVVSAPGATPVTSAAATITTTNAVFGTGFLKHETWTTFSDRTMIEPGGSAGDPDSVETITSFQTPFNAGDPPSQYSDRVSGFFIPATSGQYVFFVGSDDQSDLYLSTDDNPDNKKLIAQESIWSNSAQWTNSAGGSDLTAKRSDTFVSSEWPTPNQITLTAGQRYYIEADHQEGTGGDWVGVYAKLASAADPADATPSNLTGSTIGAVGPVQNTNPGGGATLSVASSNGSITITWTGSGTLQQATALTGNASDWTDVTPAPTGTTYTVTNPTGNRFFRIKQ